MKLAYGAYVVIAFIHPENICSFANYMMDVFVLMEHTCDKLGEENIPQQHHHKRLMQHYSFHVMILNAILLQL